MKIQLILLNQKLLLKRKKTADKYVNAKVTLNINESSEVIDGSMINQWITIDDDLMYL